RLPSAKLRDISAIHADFYQANLAGSDLTDGDFRGSRLERADLDGATTTGMKTKGALLVDGTVGH
ncbi:MAG: pentapeptide repeat-containing protein, partial [Acetobacteraceae bacterium]|nr:pentapeptide repeat-containing protein [Acetobacteraceae bacterium]